MKNIITLVFVLVTATSHATIIDAQKYFDDNNYPEAYKEYKKLAQLGNVRAQYNLAIMSFKGLGTDINPKAAYAWASIAADKDSNIKDFINQIKLKLSQEELTDAKTQASVLKDQYGYDSVQKLLGPLDLQINNENPKNESINDYKIVKNKESKNKLKYPQKALKKSGRGWVELSYNIYPDGSVQDINIMDQYPHKLFSPSAIDFISKQKYDFIKDDKKITPKNETYSTFRVKYGMYGIAKLSTRTKNNIQKILKSALSGSLQAQYQYTELYFTLLNGGGGVSGKTINKWLLRSAQFGIPQAQFRLGRNIYYGIDCQREKQKGLDWIIRAAENGIANAQYLAYSILNSENLNNISHKQKNDWLLEAAKNNSNAGQIRYAKFIASNPNADQDDLNFALTLLDKYAVAIAKTADYYQTKAILLAKSNLYTDAQFAITMAIKMAKKSHWDLSKLKKQQDEISQHSKHKS